MSAFLLSYSFHLNICRNDLLFELECSLAGSQLASGTELTRLLRMFPLMYSLSTHQGPPHTNELEFRKYLVPPCPPLPVTTPLTIAISQLARNPDMKSRETKKGDLPSPVYRGYHSIHIIGPAHRMEFESSSLVE